MKKRPAVLAGPADIISLFWTAANGIGSLANLKKNARYGRRNTKEKIMALKDYIVPMASKGPHLCSVCQRNIAACPWMHSGKPVPDWTARKTVITGNATHKNSYHVTACPLYIAPSAERLAEQARQDREDAEERRKEQNRRSGMLFFEMGGD